jgi:serine/threonine protein kinase
MQPQVRYHRGDKIGGRCEVHKALARGIGEVYLCRDLQENMPFALKTLQARYLTSPKAREYFEREAATWVAMEKHPNVVRCFCMNKVDNIPFLFLEWVAHEEGYGTDLRDWLDRRGPLEPRLALEFTLDVCRALAHAQRKVPGFVHCDIKPDNVLVAQGNLAKLTDFGLAKLVREAGLVAHDEAAPTAPGRWQVSSAGRTPPYMAPEQWRGEAVDARTDVYAVGCLLHELLSGRGPYLADSLDGLKRQHLESALPRVAGFVRALPAGDLDVMVARCLAKEPEERYASASELIAAISRLYEGWYGQPPRGVPEVAGFTAVDYSNRGKTYAELGRHEEALNDLNKALEIDASLAMSYSNRGGIYHAPGRHEDALADFNKAVRIDASLAFAYCNRGVTYDKIGRHREALADYTRAIEIEPNYAEAFNNRGNTYQEIGSHREALADFTRATEIDANFAHACFNRGVTYGKIGDREEAVADYTIAIAPDHLAALNGRGNIYLEQGRHEEALADLSTAIKVDPKFAMPHGNIGLLHAIHSEWEKALPYFERAAKLGLPRADEYVARARQILSRVEADPFEDFKNAYRAFQTASSLQGMSEAAEQFPLPLQGDFLETIEEAIRPPVPLELQAAARQRLSWLREISRKRK